MSGPTLDYIDIPPVATLLQSSSPSLRPAPTVTTSLPKSSPPPSPTTTRQRSASTSSTLSVLPQLLLSTSLPGGVSLLNQTASSAGGVQTVSGSSTNTIPKKKHSHDHAPLQLLSTRDSLSVPIMSVNFRRFVSCIGPVFWLQDRVEEIVLWKKGWTVTCVWLAAYGFFCYFPQLLLCIPHIAFIAIILATYPYPAPPSKDSGRIGVSSITPDQPPPPEAPVSWQANIQGIQNLMGAFSDFMDLVKPYTYHLCLTPAHLYTFTHTPEPLSSTSNHSSSRSPTSASDPSTPPDFSPSTSTCDTTSTPSSRPPPPPPTTTTQYLTRSSSPYTPHILFSLVTTLPVLAYVVSLPYFPLRLVMFLAGAIPIVGLHPWMMNVFLPTVVLVGQKMWNEPVPRMVVDVMKRAGRVWRSLRTWWGVDVCRGLLHSWNLGDVDSKKGEEEEEEDEEIEIEDESFVFGKSRYAVLTTLVQRMVDNDRLPDACWNADMREVELWENERYLGPMSADSISASVSLDSGVGTGMGMRRPSLASLTSLGSSSPQKSRFKGGGGGTAAYGGSWSKSNLRPTERRAWTRRRDGSESGGKENVDADGEVGSTLTFPLAPGWSFVHTEDWRKDVTAEWAVEECGVGSGGDEDGWVYSNDMWLDLRRSPSGGEEGRRGDLYVTRRRRWVRRVWYNSVAC